MFLRKIVAYWWNYNFHKDCLKPLDNNSYLLHSNWTNHFEWIFNKIIFKENFIRSFDFICSNNLYEVLIFPHVLKKLYVDLYHSLHH